MRAARRTNGPVGGRWGRLTRSALAALAVSLAVVTSLMSAVATASAAQAIGLGVSAPSAPWAAKVIETIPQGVGSCTGELISSSWVLTAAHCVQKPGGVPAEPSLMKVTIGGSQVQRHHRFPRARLLCQHSRDQ